MAAAYYPLDIFFDNPAYGVIITFILNAVYFAILGYVFLGDPVKKSSIQKYLLGMVIMTATGIVANFVPFFAFGIENIISFVPHFLVSLVLLTLINFLLSRLYFRASVRGSVIVGIIMAILTNTYLIWLAFST